MWEQIKCSSEACFFPGLLGCHDHPARIIIFSTHLAPADNGMGGQMIQIPCDVSHPALHEVGGPQLSFQCVLVGPREEEIAAILCGQQRRESLRAQRGSRCK